jgi:predicted outer membrane repeat protein
VVGWQYWFGGFFAVTQRGTTLVEMFVVIAILTVLAGLVVVPAYRSYRVAREPSDAAQVLAEDLTVLERTAQNGHRNEGSSLIIVSANPLVYRCYRGRPSSVDPNSALGGLIVERRFPNVTLDGGPIGVSAPLLFASNGSAQYVTGGAIASQHATIAFALEQLHGGRTAHLNLNLFTGAVSLPP